MRKTYLFDLYGTLIDLHTNETKITLWRAMARLYSMWGAIYTAQELKKEFFRLDKAERVRLYPEMKTRFEAPDLEPNHVENDLGLVFRMLYEAKGVEVSDEIVAYTAAAFRSISISYIQLFPGVIEMIDELHNKGCKAYLLSNAQKLFTKPEMESLGLYDKLDGILFSSDAGIMKPSPYFYRHIFDVYGLDSADCVMVGNEYFADVMGSNRVGLPSVFFHTIHSGKGIGPLPNNCIEIDDIRKVSSCIFD